MTPKESNNDSKIESKANKSFSLKADLLPAFKEGLDCVTGEELISGTEHVEKESENAVKVGQSLDAKVVNAESDKSLQKSDSAKTVSESVSASGRSIVDWFDYEPSPVETNTTLEEKKLKTKKRLDSASMNLIKNEIETSKADLRGKGKKEKEKKKVKVEETLKAEPEKSNTKDSSVKSDGGVPNTSQGSVKEVVKKVEVKGNNDAPNNKTETSEKGDIVNLESSEVVEDELEDWEKGVINDVIVDRTEDRNIDWWGAGGGEELATVSSAHDLMGCSDIYVDVGPDVIIEGEFEQEMVEAAIKDFQNADVESDINTGSNIDSSFRTQESLVKNKDTLDNETKIVNNEINYKDDEFAFELDPDPNWESDEDDFDLNGNQDTSYDRDFPENDMRAPIRPEPVYDEDFPESDLRTVVQPQPEAVPESPNRGRWVPGARKCFTCKEVGHNTENCPKGFYLH